MIAHQLDADHLGPEEDWEGNNAAFTCPACGKVFLVSGFRHRGGRPCPRCGLSVGRCEGGKLSGGSARIEWSGPVEGAFLDREEVLKAFVSGAISAGRAAELTGVDKPEFLERSSQARSSPFNVPDEAIDEELRSDLEALRQASAG